MEHDGTTAGEAGNWNEALKHLAVEEMEPDDDTELYAILGED
ncbi:hypothetical protein [Kitasatospora sp. NBC_01266]|nr:hypothetical protein [Kitasatospora sp. NBC_01266]